MSTTTAACAQKLGTPCWIGILAADIATCKNFYAALFPTWTFGAVPAASETCGICHFTPGASPSLTGGLMKRPATATATATVTAASAGSVVYYTVASVDDTCKKVVELGGKVLMGKTDEGGHGWYATFVDLDGNVFGVYEAKIKPDEGGA